MYNFNELTNLPLSDYGSWASIIGIAVSVFTLMMVLTLKKQFLFRSRVEEFSETLTKISSDITASLNSYEKNRDDIDEFIALADVTLRTAKKGASGDLLSDIKTARRRAWIYKIREFIGWKLKPNSKHARNVSKGINVVIAELKNVKQELIIGK
jgi:hypothetical protein